MYKSDGRQKIRKTMMAPLPSGASRLNKFRMHMLIKLTRDMQPPNPSFQSAKTSPTIAKPQNIKIMINRVLKELRGAPVFLPKPSIKFAIPKNRVKATSRDPDIRAVKRMPVAKEFFVFMGLNLMLDVDLVQDQLVCH